MIYDSLPNREHKNEVHPKEKNDSLPNAFQFVPADCSILELYVLVSMKRLETREQNSYNFNSIMKGLHQNI